MTRRPLCAPPQRGETSLTVDRDLRQHPGRLTTKALHAALFVALSLCLSTAKAQTNDELLQLVDSAYAEAMAGRLPEAIRINEEGLTLTPPDSMGLQCEFYSCLLFCYHRLGDYERALHYGELCLTYDEAHSNKSDLSASLGNLAGIYSSAGKHDVAIDYLNRAIRIEEELLETDPEHTAKSLAIRKAMLGEVLVAKSLGLSEEERKPLLAQALQLTKDAFRIDTELGRQPQVGMRLSQLGNIYVQLGDTAEARNCNEKALQIARETGNRATEVITLLQLGHYHEAVDLAQAIGLKKQELEACQKLAAEEKQAGHFAEAVQLLERAAALHEAIETEEADRQLTLWQVRYDTQQKEQQLQLQAQTIRTQKLRNRWLVALTALALAALVFVGLYARLQLRRKRETEQAAQEKARFYSILSHDLRSPMMAEQQVLRMLYNDFGNQDPDALRSNMAKMLVCNDIQLELLTNLQEATLIDNGKRKLQPTRLDLSGIIADAVNSIRYIAELKHITIETKAKRTLVEADRETIRTVMRNLLSNAVKFSREGATIEVGTVEPSGFYIRDFGIGMNEARRQELLTATSLVASTPGTSGEGGTGMGILICRELIRLNNGTLTIESQPNEGSTFTVTLRADT
ncbi:MAG: tetratricopeptide repeat protein [Bacteroidales bacterium]|nr:tetratricopeptide repeat protein [Bacteroidales bacterium]